MKKSIIFRADGNQKIGLGHIMRCLALAEMLKTEFEIIFAIQEPDEKVKSLIFGTGINKIIELPYTTEYLLEIDNLVTQTKDLTHIIFILDGYYFQSEYQEKLKKHCDKLVFIDDLFAWKQYADIIINHSGVVKKEDYKAAPYTQFLLGTKYALVRDFFWEYHNNSPFNFPFQKVLINLGGADFNNYSYKIIETLFNINVSLELTLILGAANANLETFKKFNNSNFTILQNINSEKVAYEINMCDIAIVSCSTIAYEVSVIGKPFIGIITASNQLVYEEYFKTVLALDVLTPELITTSKLKKILSDKTKAINTVENQKKHFVKSNLKTTIKKLLL